MLQPDEVFRVSEERQGADDILYLKLEDSRGWVFDKKPGVGTLCVRHQATAVCLHIYDVAGHGPARRINGVLHKLGTGAFHSGVEVLGQEWSFSCEARQAGDSTGVFCCEPRGCDAHAYREAVPMGHTELSEPEIRALLREMAAEWRAEDYDLFRRNCCHFSDQLCQRLGVGPVPRWVKNLARTAQALDDTRQSFAAGTRDVLARGKTARGVSPSERYKFGDITRGVVCRVADKMGWS